MRHEPKHQAFSREPLLLAAALAALGVGCDAETTGRALDGLQAQEDSPCTAKKGDIGEACTGNNCAVQLDLEITCPGDDIAQQVQLALDDKRVWGNFYVGPDGGWRSFRVQGQGLAWVDPLPGIDFAGQGTDGTMYRYLDGPAYLRSTHSGWEEVAVPGLPANFASSYGFRVRPDGVGGLHAAFQAGVEFESGTYRFATQAGDGVWSWAALGSWDPNTFGDHVGKDAWDRRFSLVHTGDWGDGPQILLNFAHFDDMPVGESGELGRVADPPRPALGGDAPIATLRRAPGIHKLLSIVDGDNWTETAIPGTEPMSSGCAAVYNVNEPICPPCHADLEGIEGGGYQLARTSGGQLWGAWFVTHAAVDVEYTAEPRGTRWRCVGTSLASASGTLHLVELGADGSVGRSLALPFDDVGFASDALGSGARQMAIAAFGDRVAVMFGAHHAAGDGLVMRLMVFETSKIE